MSNRFIYTDDDVKGIIVQKENNHLEDLLKNIHEKQTFELAAAFTDIAKELLLRTKLVAGNAAYRIREIEFYFSSENHNHNDPYVHGVSRQQEMGLWYFHRFRLAETYTHNRRGMDLTFGNKNKEMHGGILIRSVQPLSGGKPIQGPSNVTEEVVKQLNLIDNEYLTEVATSEKNDFAFDLNSPLHLEPFINNESAVINVKRYGLSNKYPHFQSLLYRYFDEAFLMTIKGKDAFFKELVKAQVYKIDEAIIKIGYNIKSL